MKKLAIIFFSMFALSACQDDDEIVGVDQSFDESSKLIAICCYDQQSEEWKTIKVNQEQLRRHMEHGDKMSPCNDTEPPSDMY